MYKGKLVKYYDDLYHNKDYIAESKFIEESSKLNKVLDVGCGTGTHIKNLCKDERMFFGIDPENEIIEKASIKFKDNPNVFFKNCHVSEFTEESSFDTVISMFNVVNHILSESDLELYFKSISELLVNGGTFIFDCFNSNAVINDKPKVTMKEVVSSAVGGSYMISCTPVFDSDTGYMKMDNNVRVFHLGAEVDRFDYTLEHRIWLLHFLEELVEKYSMRIEKIVSNFDYNKKASNNDYKITFICKKETK
tara:strand:- start:38 stop:787 length:750 start_codon:yes stop_codon:yes gene_type:complete